MKIYIIESQFPQSILQDQLSLVLNNLTNPHHFIVLFHFTISFNNLICFLFIFEVASTLRWP